MGVIVNKVENFRKRRKRSRLIIDDMLVEWKGHRLLQYWSILDRLTIPMTMTSARKCCRSLMVNSFLIKSCALAHGCSEWNSWFTCTYCAAYLLDSSMIESFTSSLKNRSKRSTGLLYLLKPLQCFLGTREF